MSYLAVKSLHIIFVVTWFAGLFYAFRLFVYHREAMDEAEPRRQVLTSQYTLMERRLWYIITWPSAILTLILGTTLLVKNPNFLSEPYMHIKLTFVALLLVYQFYGQRIMHKLQNQSSGLSSSQLRLLNEVSTVILIAVVFLIVMKDSLSWVWGIVGILGISILLMVFVRIYKLYRERK